MSAGSRNGLGGALCLVPGALGALCEVHGGRELYYGEAI